MPPPNLQGERSPLRAVTNTANSPLIRKAGSTPIKNATGNNEKANLTRMSLAMPSSLSTEKGSEKGSEKKKKLRPSLNKRVSFGGNSINVFYKQSEFSPQENEPAAKVHKTISRSSPSPQRSPYFSRPDPRILASEDEEATNDSVPLPNVPNMPDDSFFPHQDPSPAASKRRSPAPARRSSTASNGRQSFGVFIDEDITISKNNDEVRDDPGDMTIDFPRLSSVAHARRTSTSSVLSDGDITQSLHGLIPQLLREEDLCEDNELSNSFEDRPPLLPRSSDSEMEGGEIKLDDSIQRQGSAIPSLLAHNSNSTSAPVQESEDFIPKCVDESGAEDPFVEKEGLNEDDVELTSASPALSGNKGRSACSSPAVPVRVRPVPPNCRKLFDSDKNEDEDNTLHYHDKLEHPASEPVSTQRKVLGLLAAHPSTPLSASQARLQSAMEERASGTGKRNAASKLRELSSSAVRSSQPGGDTCENDESDETSFKFRDFLQAVQLNFDRRAETRQRGQSLAPQNYQTDIFDPSSLEGEIVESVKKETVFQTFNHQIQILREKIAQDNHNIEVLERQIESSRPPLFSKMAQLEGMPIHETTTYRVSMKRLRKLSTLKNKEEWVTGRQVWEKDLESKLNFAVGAVGQDISKLRDSVAEHKASNSLFVEQVAGHGLGGAFTDVKSRDESEVENKERAVFVQEMSIYRDMKGYVDSLRQEEEDLIRRKESSAPLKGSLIATCKELRKTESANSEKSVRKIITERTELNMIVSGVSGLSLQRVNKNSISLRAVDMMDIQFSLHDDKVINISCKTISSGSTSSYPGWQSYMEGAVNLANWGGGVKNVKYVRDIPDALYRCTSALRQARLVYDEASSYMNRNNGRILSGGLKHEEATPSLDLTVEASFYSLTLRSKFDITVCVTTRVSKDGATHFVQDVMVQKIHRHFGDKPEQEDISKILIESGRRDLGVYSLASGLTGVWRSLG